MLNTKMTPEQEKFWARQPTTPPITKRKLTPEEEKFWAKQPTVRPTTTPPKDYPWWQNIAAGVADPLINIANLGLRQIQRLGQIEGQSGLPMAPIQQQPSQIPTIPYSPGVSHTLGEIAGFAIPYAGQEKFAVKVLEEAQKISPLLRGLGKIVPISTAGRIARAGGIGASTAALTGDPDDSVKGAALGGALGGVGGELAGQALRGLGIGLGRVGVTDKLNKLYQQHIQPFNPFSGHETPHDKMLNTIGEHYVEALNKAKPLYDKIFNTIDEKGQFMKGGDLPSYKNTLGSMTTPDRNKLQFSDISHFMSPELEAIDPKRVHFFRTELAARMKKIGPEHPNYTTYKQAHESLGMDLKNFLKKIGLDEDYDRAKKVFASAVGPFRDINTFKRNIMPQLDKSIIHEDGQHIYSLDGFLPNVETSRTAKSLLPSSTDKTMDRFKRLETLMGGNKEVAQEHARNVLYADHMRRQPDGQFQLDIPAFLKRESALSDPQRDYLFSKRDQKSIDTLRRLNIDRLSPRHKTILQTGMGAILGNMIGHYPKLGALGGAIMGAPGFRAVERGMGAIFSPNELDELVDFINKRPSGPAVKGKAASLGAFLGVEMANGDQNQ